MTEPDRPGTPPPPPPPSSPPPPPSSPPPSPSTPSPPPPPPSSTPSPPPPPPSGTSTGGGATPPGTLPPLPGTPAATPPVASPAAGGHDDDLASLLAQIAEGEDVSTTPTVGSALTTPTDVSRPARPESEVVAETAVRFEPVFASFGERAIGLIVDWLVLDLFLLPGIVLVATGSTVGIVLGVVAMAVGFVAATVVNTRAVSRTGQTIGNRVASSKVVDARNGNLVDSGAAATRYVLRFLISPILFVGFLVAFTNPERRTFHDKFAGTIVTRPPRASWSIDDEATTPPGTAPKE